MIRSAPTRVAAWSLLSLPPPPATTLVAGILLGTPPTGSKEGYTLPPPHPRVNCRVGLPGAAGEVPTTEIYKARDRAVPSPEGREWRGWESSLRPRAATGGGGEFCQVSGSSVGMPASSQELCPPLCAGWWSLFPPRGCCSLQSALLPASCLELAQVSSSQTPGSSSKYGLGLPWFPHTYSASTYYVWQGPKQALPAPPCTTLPMFL